MAAVEISAFLNLNGHFISKTHFPWHGPLNTAPGNAARNGNSVEISAPVLDKINPRGSLSRPIFS